MATIAELVKKVLEAKSLHVDAKAKAAVAKGEKRAAAREMFAANLHATYYALREKLYDEIKKSQSYAGKIADINTLYKSEQISSYEQQKRVEIVRRHIRDEVNRLVGNII